MFDTNLALYALLLASAVTVLTTPVAARVLSPFAGIAQRPVLACIIVASCSLLVNVLAGVLVHYPIPAIRDEFSYLLAADTFSQGRLTNATHPMWQHFSSAHIIHEPSYQSKYPPGQALTLAFGQIFTGHPITGVWITLALASAAVCWMLQAWLPKGWAFLGGLLMVANVGIFSLWGQTYWGGGVSLLGGALLFGSLRRLLTRQSAWNAMLFAVALVILANSRPFEGLIASLCAGAILFCYILANRPLLRSHLTSLIIPVVIVLVPAGAVMGYFNWAVTGYAHKLPYQVWMEQSGTSILHTITSEVIERTGADGPAQEPPAPKTEWERKYLADYMAARRPIIKFFRQYSFYIGIPLTIPFLFWPMLLSNRWVLFAAITCISVFTGIFLNGTAGFAHYAAPIAPLLIFLVLQGMRYLRLWRRDRLRPGQMLVTLVSLHTFFFFTMFVFGPWRDQPVPSHLVWGLDRDRLERNLIQQGGKHLVMVRYGPEHSPQREWVYNRSSIDDAPVVWAKELGQEKNAMLRHYFSGRKVWRLAPDEGVSTLTPDNQ